MDYDYTTDDGESVAKVARKRPKVSKTMYNEDVTKLITMVEFYPCIWNKKNREYTNKTSRQNAWNTICEQFDGRYDENDLRAKWSNLRIQYRINATKRKGNEKIPVWRHFAALHFIGNVEDSRRQETISNLNLKDSIDSDNDNTPESSNFYIESPCQVAHVATEIATDADIMHTMRDAVNAINRLNDVSDVNMSFCKYIYEELKHLPENEATFLRKRIMEVLIKSEPF